VAEQDLRAAVALPGEPFSVGEARRFVSGTLADWGLADLGETVVLLVSELATNAVLHARSSYQVVLERRDVRLRVTVLDDSARLVLPRDSGPAATSGRGLALVAALAEDWGPTGPDELDGRTKGVWFELSA
jgi:anti-sigma regulatory factor (Ser/Thr protein kinase)